MKPAMTQDEADASRDQLLILRDHARRQSILSFCF